MTANIKLPNIHYTKSQKSNPFKIFSKANEPFSVFFDYTCESTFKVINMSKSYDLTEYVDRLYYAAVAKVGDSRIAEDIIQETFLVAISSLSKGAEPDNMWRWLYSIMSNKYYDWLREKYSKPHISFDDYPLGIEEAITNDEDEETLESIRRELGYLASIHREVMTRFYMHGDTIEMISRDLNIPQGTVKSRLNTSRKLVKEGVQNVKNYDTASYEPIRLYISNSGCPGMNGEPYALVQDDLIAQNILYIAYEEPISESDLAKAIGIPTAYIEPIVERLVGGELMKRVGNKIYTDFIIFTDSDKERYIPAQNEFVSKNFDLIWLPYETFYNNLRKSDFYKKLNQTKRDSLELFCFFHIFDYGLYRAFSNAFKTEQTIPDRPNGGKWVAFGYVNDKTVDNKNAQAYKYNYAGQRNIWLDHYLGTKRIHLNVFDPSGFPIKIYNMTENGIQDKDLIKLLYIIECGIDFKNSGAEERLLSSIPWLVECKILCYDKGKPKLNIPVFYNDEIKFLDSLLDTAQMKLTDILQKPLQQYLAGKKKIIPRHLKSVPLQKQYMLSASAMLMSTLRLAMRKGLIHDGGYDQEIQPPYPMILVINR